MSPPMTRMHGGGILAALLGLSDNDRGSDTASESDRTTDRNSSGTRTPDGVHSATHSLLDLALASGKRLATGSEALHVPEPRPRRERNAAGVWGSLIASTTGTFVGATAPAHSTIAPDVKRSGYRLSRWVHRVFVLKPFRSSCAPFEDTLWTETSPMLRHLFLCKGREACYLKQARNIISWPLPRLHHRTPLPMRIPTLLHLVRHHIMFVMQDGWKTCVIYPSCIGLITPALPQMHITGRQRAKALMRRATIALTQMPRRNGV